MVQIFNTHINLKEKVNDINYILQDEKLNIENYDIQYGTGYRDRNGNDKFSEVYTIIEDNITYTIVLIIDKEINDNIVFKVFQMDNNKLNKKFKVINDFILDKLKKKYCKKLNLINNDNKKLNINIRTYLKANNYLKIFIKIEKIEFT